MSKLVKMLQTLTAGKLARAFAANWTEGFVTSDIAPWTDGGSGYIAQPYWGTSPTAIGPDRFVLNCLGNYSSTEITSSNPKFADHARELFAQEGIIYFKNTGKTDINDMADLVSIIIPTDQQMEYKGGNNWRNKIAENVYDTGAPTESWVHYHHEMSYLKNFASKIAFMAKEVPGDKGFTYAGDAKATTEEVMKTDLGKKLLEKGMCYIRKLSDRAHFGNITTGEEYVYNHWQQSFITED
jgi:hypothetical protein